MLDHLAKTIGFGTSKSVVASAAIGPFLSFFGVPIFGVLMLILFVDFVT